LRSPVQPGQKIIVMRKREKKNLGFIKTKIIISAKQATQPCFATFSIISFALYHHWIRTDITLQHEIYCNYVEHDNCMEIG